MSGRIIVTGATGSMGAAAVEALAAQSVPVLMACRNRAKGDALRTGILSRVPQADLEIRELDLASLDSVRHFAAGVDPGSVTALFNNAGTISRNYLLTADGFEHTFAVNYFGPWLLTQLLLPKLPPDARIVNMVSLSCRYVSLTEQSILPERETFGQLGTYARSKLAVVYFTMSLIERHPCLRINMADPGIVDTNIIRLDRWFDPLTDILFRPFCKRPAKGVRPALSALASETGGCYYTGRGSHPIPGRYLDPALGARLWAATERLISV